MSNFEVNLDQDMDNYCGVVEYWSVSVHDAHIISTLITQGTILECCR